MSVVEIRLYEKRRLIDKWHVPTPLVLGRQDIDFGEPRIGPCQNVRCGSKVVIAPEQFVRVPRYLCRLHGNGNGMVTIENIHAQYPVVIQAHDNVPPGSSRDFELPAVILLGTRAVRVSPQGEPDPEESDRYRSLVSEPIDPNAITIQDFGWHGGVVTRDTRGRVEAGDLVELLQQVLPVIREAANTDAFYAAAANAALQIASLDRAAVFRIDPAGERTLRVERFRVPDGDEMSRDTAVGAPPETRDERLERMRDSAPPISDTIVQRALKETKTQVFDNSQLTDDSDAPSLRQIHQVVVAPILGKNKEVIGILYGDRWTPQFPAPRALHDLEAKLVEILAGAIAAGIARLEEEEQRSRMTGFFSEVVAQQLAADPTLLDPKEEDVTVMFCDLRRFSPISEKLGPVRTIEWMHDVFSELSQCVVETGGVLVNYVGDELVAMWGAPNPQEDHATRAIQTAVRMLRAMDHLDQRWRDRVGEPLRVGIGINSGLAAVGNTGSRLKFQYGVYGNVVNTASRLQSATKQFGVDCLVSAATVQRSREPAHRRHLATVLMVGIEEPVQVWQLTADAPPDWDEMVTYYETALGEYQQSKFADSARRLGQLLERFPDDQPSRRLLSLAVNELSSPSENFCPIVKLTTK